MILLLFQWCALFLHNALSRESARRLFKIEGPLQGKLTRAVSHGMHFIQLKQQDPIKCCLLKQYHNQRPLRKTFPFELNSSSNNLDRQQPGTISSVRDRSVVSGAVLLSIARTFRVTFTRIVRVSLKSVSDSGWAHGSLESSRRRIFALLPSASSLLSRIITRGLCFLPSFLLHRFLSPSFLDLMNDTAHDSDDGVDGATDYHCIAAGSHERFQAIFAGVWFRGGFIPLVDICQGWHSGR